MSGRSNVSPIRPEPADGAPLDTSPTTTREAILEVAVKLLEEHGADGFTIDEVLIESSASASSLYHHFRNREGLLQAAQAQRYLQLAMRESRRNLEGGFAAQTTDEFLDFVTVQLRRIVTDPANQEVRRSRLQVAGQALRSPDLAARMLHIQELMLDAVAEVFDDAQARGLINPDLDPRAYSAWFHAMTLGSTIIEGGAVDTDAWLAVAIPATLAPLRPKAEDPPASR